LSQGYAVDVTDIVTNDLLSLNHFLLLARFILGIGRYTRYYATLYKPNF